MIPGDYSLLNARGDASCIESEQVAQVITGDDIKILNE